MKGEQGRERGEREKREGGKKGKKCCVDSELEREMRKCGRREEEPGECLLEE